MLNLISGVLSDFFSVNNTKPCLTYKNDTQTIKPIEKHIFDVRLYSNLLHAYTRAHVKYTYQTIKTLYIK